MTTDVHPPNPFDAQDAAGFVTVCGWCPELHILKLPRRDLDVIVAMQMGKDIQIQRNGQPLTISHGMCEQCKAAQVQSVSREPVAPVPAENAAETGAGSTKETKQTPAPAAPVNTNFARLLLLANLLERGVTLVESAVSHVSHGGPTRADAENWLLQAKAVLEQ